MHYQSDGTQITARPAIPAVSGTPGYANPGNAVAGIQPSNIDPILQNAIVDEIAGVVLAAGITLDKTNNAQLLAAIKIVAAGRLLGEAIFNNSGTYTPPPGTTKLVGFAYGGGGAGGGAFATNGQSYSTGSGGGSGGWGKFVITNIPASIAIVIGAGGVPVSGAMGGSGGATVVGPAGTPYITAPGGGGGASAAIAATSSIIAAQGAPGGSAAGSAATLAAGGNPGACGFVFANLGPVSGQGGASPLGGGAGPNTAGGTGGQGGASGAGGGGSSNTFSAAATLGGPGAAGLVIIQAFS